MSKKLICLILGLVMLLGVALTSCAGDEVSDKQEDMAADASVNAMTITMYVMSENVTTNVEAEKRAEKMVADSKKDKDKDNDLTMEEALESIDKSAAVAYRVEKALSTITENKLGTKLEIFFYTEKDYYNKIDKNFADRKQADKDGTSKVVTEIQNDEPAFNPETGKIEIKYPKVADYQVDIFYIGGKANFAKYKSQGLLSQLDDQINIQNPILKTVISAHYLNNMRNLNGRATYALPTNNVIGEYTYLLLNKDALEKAYIRNKSGDNDYSSYTSLTCDSVQSFLEDVSNANGTLKDEFTPLYTNVDTDELLISNLRYWGVDDEGKLSDAFSVLGGYYSDSDEYLEKDAYAGMENLFENEQFINDLKTLKSYEFNNYYKTEENKKFAVGYVKGGAELADKYADEYEMIVLESPRLTEEEIYSDLYAVSTQTSSLQRSMDVVTLLNTNEEFRNILLYGLEGEHFQLVDTEIDNKYEENIMAVEHFEKSEVYKMDIDRTGNTFIVYPTTEDIPQIREYGVIQNGDAKVDLTLGFDISDVEADKLKEIKALSDKILKDYLACKNETELEAFLTAAKQEIGNVTVGGTEEGEEPKVESANENVAYHLSKDNSDSFYYIYMEWLSDMDIID